MGEFDLDTYQHYQQLLSGKTHLGTSGGQDGAAASPFFQPPPPQAPTLPGDQWVIDPVGYASAEGFSALPQPLQIPGGGVWSGNYDGFVHQGDRGWPRSGNVFAQGQAWAGTEAEDSRMHGGDAFLGNDQLVHGGGVPGVSGGLQDLLMGGVDLSMFMSDEAAVNSLWASAMMGSLAAAHQPMVLAAEPNQPASESSGPSTQVGEDDSPRMMPQMPAYPTVVDYQPAASVNIPHAVPDEEDAKVAQLVRAAAQCSDDKASTVWSEEEKQLLREGLCRFAGQDNVTKCFSIASGLANKTVLDVAYRIRWLSDLEKKKADKQAQLMAEKSAEAKVTKGKGTKGATRKNNKYPLSKEVLDSKSAKDLIRDSDRLMDKIEEILKTGQVKNSPDYFYYVKMNMDTLLNKVTDVATVMDGLSVDDEEWEDVLKDRHSPSDHRGLLSRPPTAHKPSTRCATRLRKMSDSDNEGSLNMHIGEAKASEREARSEAVHKEETLPLPAS